MDIKTTRKPVKKLKRKNIREEAIKYIPPKKRRKFAFTKNFAIYLIVFAGALIFTQALRSPLSSLMLIFVTFIPAVLFIHVMTAIPAIGVYAENSSEEVQKNAPLDFTVDIINSFFIPYPFIEADIMLPNENIVRCVERRVGLSLAPNGYYNLSERIKFQYRGEYNIGISKIYVYDLFKIFRIAIDINVFTSIFVTPRRLVLENSSESTSSDLNTDSSKNILGIDRSELNEIRDYRNGDHIKNIHWKLSSKTQELMVKEYTMNSGKNIYIFIDMAAHYDTSNPIYSDDINEFMVDGVIELALAAALRELGEGNSCTMIWYDERVESETQICLLQTPDDMNNVFKMFATAALCSPGKSVSKLAALIEETQAVTMIFVSGFLNKDVIKDMSEIATVYGNESSQGSAELYHYSVAEKILDKKEYDAFIEYEKTCKIELTMNGIKVYEPKFNED